MIYLFHGFGGSSTKSNTVQQLLKNIQQYNDMEIVPIDYSSTDPNKAFDTINTIVSKDNDPEKIFIGVSLGGFWARYFANQYPNSKLIMINPAINALDGKEGTILRGIEITHDMVTKLQPYKIVTDNDNIAITVIVSTDDEVINPKPTIDTYKNRGDIHYTSGGHQLNISESILKIINTAILTIAG